MSNFLRWTKHPETGLWEYAYWIDDYYEHYHYGVRFRDDKVFDPHKTTIRIADLTIEEADILNAHHKKCQS